MKYRILALLALNLLSAPGVSIAAKIESTTGVLLTFRNCIAGETPCDQLSEPLTNTYDGLPGNQQAEANDSDPAYGTVSGSVRFTGLPGGSQHSSEAVSLPGARNGANTTVLQKFTNSGAGHVTVRFSGTLNFDQVIPDENTSFPEDSPGRSAANAELGMVRMSVEVIEAGSSKEDNLLVLMDGPPAEVEVTELASDMTKDIPNRTDSGTRTIAASAMVGPGESVWLWAVTQSLAANGAKVTGSLTTRLEVVPEAGE